MGVTVAPAVGTYALGGGGRLRVTREDTRRVAMLEVEVPCFGHLFFTQIAIAPKGRIAMTRDVMGKRSVFTTRLDGGFGRKNGVRLTLHATGGGCEGRTVTYSGRRS
jgi:hypothetical protein